MPYSLSWMGTNVNVLFHETLLDIALVLMRPVTWALMPTIMTQFTDRAGTYLIPPGRRTLTDPTIVKTHFTLSNWQKGTLSKKP